jgi:hypothetical protein
MMKRATDRKPLPARRGIVTLKLVLAAALLFSLVALVVDIGLLIARTDGLKTTTDAAALAGAAVLAENIGSGDEDNDDIQVSQTPEDAGFQFLPPVVREVCRTAAQFAFDNPVSGYRLWLGNPADGRVTVGWIEHAHLGPECAFEIDPDGQMNAVRVHSRLPVNGVSALTLSFFRRAGHDRLECTSIAVFDQKLVGFRPVGSANVPLVPLLVCLDLSRRDGSGSRSGEDRESEHSPGESDSGDDEVGIGNPSDKDSGKHAADDHDAGDHDKSDHDNFGALLPGSSVELTIQPGQAGPSRHHHRGQHLAGALRGVPLQFGEEMSLEEYADQILYGLDSESLADRGGEFLMDDSGGADVAVRDGWSPEDAENLEDLFSNLIGRPRVFAVGRIQPGGGTARVTGFLAGIITQVTHSGSEIRLSLNLMRMHTCTALVAESAARNPWIGKVMLIR